MALQADRVPGKTEGEFRDQLAVERTHLANERTLLAYVRTALACAACGAALLHFFPALGSLGWLLVVIGGAMLVVGVIRYFVVRTQLLNRRAATHA